MLIAQQNLRGLYQLARHWMPTLPSPESADRVLTCGMSYLQHIGGGGRINMWYPRQRAAMPQASRLEWLAIRQVEVLYEGCHIELFDMEMENFKRSLKFFNVARARSIRLAVIIGGHYNNPRQNQDHLHRFDHRFRRRLQSMINMLWLDEMNAVTRRTSSQADSRADWDITALLPQLGTLLNAQQIFRPAALQHSPHGWHLDEARKFLGSVDNMPRQSARDHSVYVGLKIPKLQDDNDIDWGPAPEFQRLPFIQALQSVFGTFGMEMPSTHHPRGHGDHMHARKRHHVSAPTAPELLHA